MHQVGDLSQACGAQERPLRPKTRDHQQVNIRRDTEPDQLCHPSLLCSASMGSLTPSSLLSGEVMEDIAKHPALASGMNKPDLHNSRWSCDVAKLQQRQPQVRGKVVKPAASRSSLPQTTIASLLGIVTTYSTQ